MRRPPESVTTNHVQIPRVILERHQVVTLTVDVMFVNGVPFLVSASHLALHRYLQKESGVSSIYTTGEVPSWNRPDG